MAAGLAHPQVDPAHPQRQALLAAGDLGREVDHAGSNRDVRRWKPSDEPRAWAAARHCDSLRPMSGPRANGEPITEQGLEDLRTETRRPRRPAPVAMAARIKVAREEGDLKENAEYHVAKEDQAHLETRIKRLRERLHNAVVVEADGAAADVFAFGRTAEVLDESSGKVNTWTLVGSTEADLAAGRLSAESPIGRALMDAKVGKPVKVETPKGSNTFVVKKLVG